jgi:hypothetical protein
VASLLDVFPTFVALASAGAGIMAGGGGAPRLLDGVDITSLLIPTTGAGSGDVLAVRWVGGRGCLFFYGGTPGAGSEHRDAEQRVRSCPGLWAVRCGAYKRHYVTRDGQRVNPTIHSVLHTGKLHTNGIHTSDIHTGVVHTEGIHTEVSQPGRRLGEGGAEGGGGEAGRRLASSEEGGGEKKAGWDKGGERGGGERSGGAGKALSASGFGLFFQIEHDPGEAYPLTLEV